MNAAIGRIIGPQLQANTAFCCFPFPFNSCWILKFAWWLFFFYWRRKIELPWGNFTLLPYGIGFSFFQIISFNIIRTFKEKENSFHTQTNNDVGGRELKNKKPLSLVTSASKPAIEIKASNFALLCFPFCVMEACIRHCSSSDSFTRYQKSALPTSELKWCVPIKERRIFSGPEEPACHQVFATIWWK